nr:hypothetical protein [Gemmobacter straminiformis]
MTDLPFEVPLFGFELSELAADAARITVALEDEGQRAIDATRDFVEFLLQSGAVVCPAAAQALYLRPEACSELFDQVLASEQDIRQRREDAVLEFCNTDTHRTTAGSPFPAGRAGVAFAVDDGHSTATCRAADKTGKETLLGLALIAGLRTVAATQGLGGLPSGIVNDLQVRDFLSHPEVFRVHPRLPLAAVGILHEALPVVGDAPEVEFVVEDTVLASPASVDGGGVPEATAGAGNALPVETGRNRSGWLTGCIVSENLAHHCRLVGMDLSLAPDQVAVFGNAPDHAVAIAVPAWDAPSLHPPALPTPGLLRQILQEKRVHRALEANMQLVDLALG